MAGESAQREYDRRRSKRQDRIRRSWPLIAGLIAASFAVGWGTSIVLVSAISSVASSVGQEGTAITVTVPPVFVSAIFAIALAVTTASELLGPSRSEASWSRGAEGERIVGRVLDTLADDGVHVLHDRRIPGSRANIDHLAVTPAGVFTIDAKRYSGKLEVRGRGAELWIKGRNRSPLLEQARGQAGVVREVLERNGFANTAVTSALCFVGTEMPLLFPPKQAGGVVLTRPRQLRDRLRSGREEALGPAAVASITKVLDEALVPADGAASGWPSGQTVQASVQRSQADDRTGANGAPTCRCGEPMVIRTRRRDGARFYGCSTFPGCRYTRPLA